MNKSQILENVKNIETLTSSCRTGVVLDILVQEAVSHGRVLATRRKARATTVYNTHCQYYDTGFVAHFSQEFTIQSMKRPKILLIYMVHLRKKLQYYVLF